MANGSEENLALRLANEHVIVTGGASGIGAAVAEKALLLGASVSIIDIDDLAGRQTVGRLASFARIGFTQGDVCKAAEIEIAFNAAVFRFGPVTGLVNSAGRNSYSDPVTMTETQWDQFFALDLKAAWLCSRAVLPSMLAARRGSIVNIASVHADHTSHGYFPYAAAKSGLVGLTRSLALEVGPSQVRVNALSPGWTDTPLVRQYFERADPAERQKVLDVHPMGRIATPMEVANCVSFLLSSEASFVTGANWRVDGGMGARFAG